MRHLTTTCRTVRVWAIALALVLAPSAAAQQPAPGSRGALPPAAQRADSDSTEVGAPVIFAGDTLLHLSGRLGPFSAAERAATAGERLRELAGRPSAARDSVIVVPGEAFDELVAGGTVLLTVLDDDAAPLGRSRAAAARDWAATLQSALRRHAEGLTLRALLLDGVYALLATALLVVLLRLMAVAFPRVNHRLEALRRVRLPALRVQQLELVSADRLGRALLLLSGIVRAGLTLLLLYLYVPLVLSFFPWTAPLSRQIVGYALTPLAVVWGALVAYVPNVFYVAVIVLVTRYVLKLVRAVFRALESGAITLQGFHREWGEPTYKIARFLVLAFAAVVVFPYLPGAHTEAFKGVSIFLGVLLSLGSSSAIGNLVAGVVLTYTRAFRIGDRVRIGDAVGDVVERTLLVTRVRTIKNEDVTIPNTAVLGGQVANYTTHAATHGLILHTTATIGYDAPWRQVHALMLDAAKRTPHVLAEPAPFVLQTSLDDFYVSYQLNAYTDRADRIPDTYSLLHANIQDAFNEAGVEIMSPHYTALRDGNAIAIPVRYVDAGYEAPTFRVAQPGARADGTGRNPRS